MLKRMAEIIPFEPSKRRIKAQRKLAEPAEDRINHAFEDLLRQILSGSKGSIVEGMVRAPSTIQLRETEAELQVQFNLNGFLKEEVRVRLEDNQLIVDLYRTSDATIDPAKSNPEDLIKSLSQRIPLPVSVEREGARAEFNKGSLTVFLLKKKIMRTRSTEIPVQEL